MSLTTPSRVRRGGRLALLVAACSLAAADRLPAQTGAGVRGGRSVERAAAVAVLADRSVVSAGVTASAGAGGLDAWVHRATACGAPLWSRTLGTAGDERATGLVGSAAGVLVVGDVATDAGDLDGWWVRLDDAGESVWSGRLGDGGDDALLGAAAVTGGGFLLVGQVDGLGAGGLDGWVVRLDAAGALLWQTDHGGPGEDRLHAVAPLPDGGAWVAGETDSAGAGFFDLWLMRLDADGDVLLERTLGGAGDEVGRALTTTAAGGVAVAGFSDSAGAGLFDVLVVGLDEAGGLAWQRALGGADDDVGLAIAASPFDSQRLIVTGQSRSLDPGAAEGWSAGLDAAVLTRGTGGGVPWQRRYGGAAVDAIEAAAAGGSGWALAGGTASWGQGADDGLLVRVDDAGRVLGRCGAAGEAMLAVVTPALVTAGAFSSSAPLALEPVATGFDAMDDALVSGVVCPATPGEVSPPGAANPLVFTARDALAWEASEHNCAERFHLYRGELPATGGARASCLAADLPAPQAVDPADPGPGAGFFYLVSGTAAGVEGTLGRDSSGAVRLPAVACR